MQGSRDHQGNFQFLHFSASRRHRINDGREVQSRPVNPNSPPRVAPGR